MRIGTGIRIGRVGGRFFTQMAGSVVDMDFKTGNYVGTTPAALTATTGALKITSSGLQVVTGDLITSVDATLLAALNATTTVIRCRVNIPNVTGASNNGFIAGMTGANVSIIQRLRASPNQSGVAGGHAPAGSNAVLASGVTGSASDGVSFTAACRHRTTSATIGANGGALAAGAPTGKSSTIDTVVFGSTTTGAGTLLNGFLERLTIWTDDPNDATLIARSI